MRKWKQCPDEWREQHLGLTLSSLILELSNLYQSMVTFIRLIDRNVSSFSLCKTKGHYDYLDAPGR